MKRTKIICTLGPASKNLSTLKKMIRAGMNAVRLNFSHGTYQNFDQLIKNIKQASQELGQPIALIQDLQGPKIRLGELPKEGIKVTKGQKIILKTGKKYDLSSNPIIIPEQYKKLPKEVKKDDLILIDDGFIELKVISTNKKDTIIGVLQNSGVLKSHKGINVPGATLSAASLSPKDLRDLKFALKYDLDYIALSFVKNAEDILYLKNLLTKLHSKAKIIAKIERFEAVKNIEEIAQVTDGLMVARGDLGLEIAAEKVPLVQKQIIRFGHIYGKPTIIATQMLQSMVENPRATRAEISDIATAIFDHADCLMLSNETAVGKYPIEAVKTLAKVAKTVEKDLKIHEHLLPDLWEHGPWPIINATCQNACELAENIHAEAIVCLTDKGKTARLISNHRIYIPIITLTNNAKTKNQLSIVWGINQIYPLPLKNRNCDFDETRILHLLKQKKIVKPENEVVIVNITKNRNLISTKVIS